MATIIAKPLGIIKPKRGSSTTCRRQNPPAREARAPIRRATTPAQQALGACAPRRRRAEKKEGAGPVRAPRARAPARGWKGKKPAASYSRTGDSRTTLGDGALDFRVRNGNG